MKRLLLALLAALTAARAPAADPFAGARRVVFLGDSITYAGAYVDYVEAALRLDDPGRKFGILDLGLPSETVSGLSEPGHAGGKFPRPDLHERLDRVLTATRPDLVVACYGMNDGIYRPFDEERFRAFRDGIGWMRARVLASGARIVLLTPPTFDPLPLSRRAQTAAAVGTPAVFPGYNEVLDRYSAWLLGRRAAGWTVIDVHGLTNAALAEARRGDPGFSFAARDGVHPDARGHAVIAQAVLLGLGLPPGEAGQPRRWADGAETPLLTLIRERRKLLSDAWLTAAGHKRPGMAKGLPLPEAEKKAAGLEKKIEDLLAP